MKYAIDNELIGLEKQKALPNIYLYPFVNVFLRMVRCSSDDKVCVTKYKIPGFKNGKINTLVIEPKNAEGVLPCIVLYHGGGMLLKASKAHYQMAKWYAEKANCRVVFPDYRLMPKNRYPVAIEDGYSAYLWVIDNAEQLGIDKTRIVLAGDSAGAYIAEAVTLMIDDRDKIAPKGNLLIYPVTDKRMEMESMKLYTDTPVWNSELTKMFWKAYLADKTDVVNRYASPIESESLKMFPKTYIEVAEFDCLRDEGIAFSEKLHSDGVPVELHEIKGTCHGFEVALKSKIVQNAVRRRIDWIRAVFN